MYLVCCTFVKQLAASCGCICLSFSAVCPWIEPLIVPCYSALDAAEGFGGEHSQALWRTGGVRDAVLPTECPAWGQVRASPNKALDVCEGEMGEGTVQGCNANCFVLLVGPCCIAGVQLAGVACWKGFKDGQNQERVVERNTYSKIFKWCLW